MRARLLLGLCVGFALPAAADGHVRRVGDHLELSRAMRFEVGRATIVQSDLELVDALAEYLSEHPEVRLLEIRAHTDDLSAERDDYVQTPLGRQRAQSMREALVARGVAHDRVTAIYVGADQPLCDLRRLRGRRLTECRTRNRRIEILVR